MAFSPAESPLIPQGCTALLIYSPNVTASHDLPLKPSIDRQAPRNVYHLHILSVSILYTSQATVYGNDKWSDHTAIPIPTNQTGTPDTRRVMGQAAHSAPVRTQTKTGPRYQTLPRGGVFRIGLPSGIIVSDSLAYPPGPHFSHKISGKKLKRRLEDLERRAASTSASPEQQYQELARPEERATSEKHTQSSRGRTTIAPQRKQRQSPEPMSSDFRQSHNDQTTISAQRFNRELSASPPPLFSSYSTYPPSEPIYYADYSQQPPSQAVSAPFYDHSSFHHYNASLHSTLPIMPSSADGIKQETLFPDDDFLSPFNMNYASISAMDVNPSQAYSDASAQVNYPIFFPSSHFS